MADTKRTSADLLANLFQDGQLNNSITAQDMRDLIVTLKQSRGAFNTNVAAVTNVIVAGTFLKAAGTTTFETSFAEDMDDDGATDNRIRYIGAPARKATIAVTAALSSTSNNQTARLAVAKNGVVLPASPATARISSSSDIESITLFAGTDIVTNDYLELWMTNDSGTGSVITIDTAHFLVIGNML